MALYAPSLDAKTSKLTGPVHNPTTDALDDIGDWDATIMEMHAASPSQAFQLWGYLKCSAIELDRRLDPHTLFQI